MLEITKCPILNSDNFTVDNNGQKLGPNPAELTSFAGKVKNLVENFNKLQSLLNDIKATYPDKYNVDGIWGTCSKGLMSIEKVVRKPCIQIGFLGQSNSGKSSSINRLFGDLAGTGTTGVATSSAVVSYYVSNQEKWQVTSMDSSMLDHKNKLSYKKMLSDLQLSGDETDFVTSYKKILDKLSEQGNIVPVRLKTTWDFINAMKDGNVQPFGEKHINTRQDFLTYVNHTTSINGDSRSHAVFHGRSTGLPKDVPVVLEIVDVPGVGMNDPDDYVVSNYNLNIDAWIVAYAVNLYDGKGITDEVIKSRKNWCYKNGNLNGDKTCRFSLIINKLGLVDITLVDGYRVGWDSRSTEFGRDRFFVLDSRVGVPTTNDHALNDQEDFGDLIKNSLLFQMSKLQAPAIYANLLPQHLVELKRYEQLIRQCMFDGGISNFKRFLLYQWPIQIVSEIIAKSESDISEFLVDAVNLKSKLEQLLRLTPNEIIDIQKATSVLSEIRGEISKASFRPLADGLNKLINQQYSVYRYDPGVPINQVINWFKTEAKIGATEILSQIVIDGGLINECYNYIEDKGDFCNHNVRVSPTSNHTLTLNVLWNKTLPLKKEILTPKVQQDIIARNIPYELIISFIEDSFWKTLKNKTGIDELLADLTMFRQSETGEIKIDMFDWAKRTLDYQNNLNNYKRLDNLIKEAVNTLAVDCAEVIKNFLLEQINKLIDERQEILFLCS